MGVLAPRLRTRDGPLVPPSTRAEIFRRTCLQSHLQTSLPTPQKSYLKFRNPRIYFEIFNTKIKKPKNAPQGPRGGLRICLGVNISVFCENKPPVKFQNSNWPPSKMFKKNLKMAPRGPGVEGPNFIFFPRIFIIFFRSPCTNLKPYDNPFCGFE